MMRLVAPASLTFIIALVLAALALLSLALPIPLVGPNRFWFMTAAWAVLGLGNLMKEV
jgi:4-amino-4-deoxy-L-arabinose transferase-like glycosyltransferase